MKPLIAYICFILSITTLTYAKEWRSIIPLHSTCEDVKRHLGVTSCDPSGSSLYQLQDERVYIVFSGRACDTSMWNVPPGTVITIDVYPKKQLPINEYHIDESRYKKKVDNHVLGYVYYYNDEEGVTYTVYNGKVTSISYRPSAKDDCLRCPESQS